ncbi:MAG: hypothetical protein AAFX05_15060 [Planctomycetota bacterium]
MSEGAGRSRASGGPGRTTRVVHVSLAVGLVVVALGTLASLGAVALSRSTPSWWTSVTPDDPATIASAESLERRVSSEMTLPRSDEVWTLEISEASANAWLNVRLPMWLSNHDMRWPGRIGRIAVDFRDDAIVVGAEVLDAESDGQIVGATLTPHIGASGGLGVSVRSLHVGALMLPGRLRAAHIEHLLPEDMLRDPEGRQVLEALVDGVALTERAEVSVDDLRLVRLRDVNVESGVLRLTCVTEVRTVRER